LRLLENCLGLKASQFTESPEMSKVKGFVLCSKCRKLESYWKGGEFAFFMCRINGVSMKTLENHWRKCGKFERTNQSPTRRINELK
jgi:hypothetical protein